MISITRVCKSLLPYCYLVVLGEATEKGAGNGGSDCARRGRSDPAIASGTCSGRRPLTRKLRTNGNAKAAVAEMNVDLTDEEAAALLRSSTTSSRTIATCCRRASARGAGFRAKFPTALPEPPPARTPTPEERSPGRAPRSGRPRLGDLMTPLGPCDDHIYRSAPAARAHEPIAPIENASLGAISPHHLGGVGFDLVVTRLTPHDQSDASCRPKSSPEIAVDRCSTNRGRSLA